jgi:hypothetical protein
MGREQTIADLAYGLWQARGSPHGSAEIDWAEAERQVLGKERPAGSSDSAATGSFPASDPPASRLPDVPPSNAADKWETVKSVKNKKEIVD